MQLRISKALEGLLARTTFETAKAGVRHALKDWLMLNILRDEGSMASRIFALHLQDWQRYQIALRIERMAQRVVADVEAPERFFAEYAERLSLRFFEARRVSTAHAVVDILEDATTLSSRVFAMYGLTADIVLAEMESYGAVSDVHSDVTAELAPLAEAATTGEGESLLRRFGCDLTAMARNGELDPVVGREVEIERLVQILSRRKKNNPVLVGEAGVGKSAIVEGLALRIVEGTVPASIASKRLVSLDVASLVAGTKFRGEFEERMQQLLDELRGRHNTIVFIDEIHTIVGAGATQGSLDTANILKPALARGEVQVVGATTLDEYRASVERDAALERRFQRVLVEPATVEQTLDILGRLSPIYAQHHGVRYDGAVLRACVELTQRYITDRHFPDKAIDLLDEAGAVARLRGGGAHVDVTADDVARVVMTMTGVPLDRIGADESVRLRHLEQHLQSRIVGQEEAVRRVAAAIRRSRTGLRDESRPIGVFLFVGPTGVGKTLLAKELSQQLFDERNGLVRIDMSEYGEAHNVARLIGSPPGYVGYGEGGQLGEAVRRHPYSVVLFDEIEKAHSDLFNLLLQIFDEGRLTDGTGRTIDFRNTVIIMTSNVGSREVAARGVPVGYDTRLRHDATGHGSEYRRALERTFAPEFLNRIDEVVLFRPLGREDMARIVRLELDGLLRRVARLGFSMRVTPAARRSLATMGYESRYGARPLKRLIAEMVEEPISDMILEGLAEGATLVVERSGEGVRLKVA